MKIKKILWRFRRDFSADYECEHCGYSVDNPRIAAFSKENFHWQKLRLCRVHEGGGQ
jgi:hypothetical protein